MLIDGKLVDGEAGTFDNINPATEEVLGEVADASKADMHRAIDAARRAFDETDWSTNHQLRKRCLEQLHDAIEAEMEELREELILEVGCAAGGHPRPAARRPAGRRPEVSGQADRRVPVGDRPRRRRRLGHRREHHPQGLARAGRRRRRDRAVELPVRGHHQQARPGAGHRQHRGAQAGARHPVQRHPARPAHRREHRHPAGVVNVVTASDHFVGEELTLSPKVDLISFTGSTAVGKRIMEKGAATMKRLFLELGGKSATIVLEDADFGTALPHRHRRRACTPARAAPCRPGCCCPAPATTRASRSCRASTRTSPPATRRTPAPCAAR